MESFTHENVLNVQYISDEEFTTSHHLTIRLDDIENDHDSSNSTEELEIVINPKEISHQQRHQIYTYKEFNKKVI